MVTPVKRSVLCLVISYCVLFTTACPSPTVSQLDRAAKASYEIAGRTGQVIALVRTLYESDVISLALKDKLAAQLEILSHGGKRFNDLIIQYSEQYRDGNIPANAWSILIASFDDVWAPFGEILNMSAWISGLKDSKAFQVISAAIMEVAKILVTHGVRLKNYHELVQAS